MKRIPEELLGPWNKIKNASKFTFDKFWDRNRSLQSRWTMLNQMIPEYLVQQSAISSKKVVDISAAGGATLEIMKYFGYEVLGIDCKTNCYKRGYHKLMESQNIPYKMHDCSILPYPLADQSFDLLINTGAITVYGLTTKKQYFCVLNEFARITREAFFVIANYGIGAAKVQAYIEEWSHPDFSCVFSNVNKWKWKRKQR